ncbi:uncharacterized protein N0V89_007206 [Didymosphaeria variabile]|uniref:Fork-head domain-containing protein n=1 Tax=Didymosphaeria variabile TaxID=1932322 RepID=A0A9W8XJ34_9PLEO|nr:uncharacterized protein N0V89_007206 [Didymosphaeria variabile]KAJ4351862.1 hypothetical protein N0V89_007206 [Didymosphaeria variabile]
MKVENLDDPAIMQWGTYNNPLSTPMPQGNFGFNYPMQYNPGTASAYNYDRTAYNDQYTLAYQPGLSANCPRSLNNNSFDMTGLSHSGVTVSSHPPPMYQRGPQQPYEGMDLTHQSPNNNLMQLDHEYEDYPRPIPEDLTAYSTPYDSDISRAATPSDGSPLPLRNDALIEKDQPYAQLIFRALKDAPNHTMILRDIYDWFRQNTDKAAASDSKGWQNSIRHNLSMNGAFEKVDQPGEEARKGFMWRLTQDALANGVKSTTRYRSKQPNKRGHRTGLYPQRQLAGAMGGRSAKKQLRHKARMHDAYRSDPYQSPSRSMPTPATFDSAFNSEMSMYSGSPSYYSPSGSEVDAMEYQPDAYGPATDSCVPQQIFHGLPNGSMSSSPLAAYNDGYIQLPSDPAVPLFTSSPADTPSPSASEPLTPDSQASGWDDNFYGNIGGIGFEYYGGSDIGISAINQDGFAHEPLGEGE